MSLPLLLGECPSKGGDRFHDFPLSGAIGQRLCTWAGIEPEAEGSRYGRYYWALRERFDCLNAMERHTHPWSDLDANARVRAYFAEEGFPEIVVCLGRRAATAIGLDPKVAWGEWWPTLPALIPFVPFRAVVIPHPSARNLLYNDEAMVELAKRVLREAMSGFAIQQA